MTNGIRRCRTWVSALIRTFFSDGLYLMMITAWPRGALLLADLCSVHFVFPLVFWKVLSSKERESSLIVSSECFNKDHDNLLSLKDRWFKTRVPKRLGWTASRDCDQIRSRLTQLQKVIHEVTVQHTRTLVQVCYPRQISAKNRNLNRLISNLSRLYKKSTQYLSTP